MVGSMEGDRVWDRKGLLYDPYMANILTRRQYYLMQPLSCTDVISLLEDGNGEWADASQIGGGGCRDEPVAPHKGLLPSP